MTIYKLISFFILLTFSAFFSGSETALLSIDNLKFRKLQKRGGNTRYISRLIKDPNRLLITVLVGNMLVNVAASALATSMLIDLFGNKGTGISIGIMTFLLLVFGEVTPKTYAINRSENFSRFVSRPLWIFSKLITPIRKILTFITNKITSLIDIESEDKEPFLTEEEFKTVLKVGHKEGQVKEQEKEMINAVLDFTDTTAEEIMTPRVDIKAVPLDMEKEKFIEFAKNIRHAKIPVYVNSIDKIIGVIYTKEAFLNPQKKFNGLVKPVLFVPGAKKIYDLAQSFGEQKTKVAVVIDEYGGTDGLVTAEDINEEIFGEIYDEFEVPEKIIEQINENQYKISGKALITDVNEELDINLPEEQGIIAGFVLELFEKIPKTKETIKYENLTFQIEELAGKRIRSIIIKK